jgi:hypothetical protein
MTQTIVPKLLAVLLAVSVSQLLADEKDKPSNKPIEIRLVHGSQDQTLNYLMRFENMFLEHVEILGDALQGRHYQVIVKELRNGKLIRTETLFDGTEADFFRIKDNQLTFDLLCKTQDGKLRLQICTPKFSSKRLKLDLLPNEMDYALKDFAGSKPSLHVSADKPIYLFAVIPPTMHADGTGSYCEVAQSEVPPEEFGNKFQLSQYFLLEMRFLTETKKK